MRQDKNLARMLDQMPSDVRKAELLRALKKEIAAELSLPSFQEWKQSNLQGDLFSRTADFQATAGV